MSLVTSLKHVGGSIVTSMVSLDVLTEPTVTKTLTDAQTLVSSDSDTKKLLIAGATSIITQVLLKLIENVRKKRARRKQIKPVTETDQTFI